MALDVKRIRQELESPSRRESIARALAHQDWIRLHAETHFEHTTSVPLNNLMDLMKSQLPQDKYNNAVSLLRFPLPSYEVVDSIFDALSDIFTGRNPVFSYQFMSASDIEDWEYYRHNVLQEPSFWSTTAWSFFKTEINSIVVVDLPADGAMDEDGKVTPYCYFVPLSAVVSYGLNMRGDMTWVMFRNSEGGLTVIDDESYRTFELKDGQELGSQLSNNPHFLQYCPATFFWKESLSVTDPGVKKSPLSKALSKLDWYVFSDINKRNLDIYGAYPIYWAFEEECDYQDGNGNVCDHGVMSGPDGKHIFDPLTNSIMLCPKCSKHRITGPGSFIRVPIPEEGQPDLSNPIGLVGIDRESLEYNVEDLKRQKTAIVDSCVGKDSDIVQEASLADKQIDATFEKRTSVLENVKQGFERIQKFVDETVCRLRYGKSFLRCSVNYGTEFFTLNVASLRKRYTEAKDAGAPQSELASILDQIVATEYRNNPQVIERMKILMQVEPYPILSRNDVLNLWEKGVCDTVELELKQNFAAYVTRFERENGNITEFGIQMDFTKRVETISTTLKSYAEKSVAERKPRSTDSADVQGTTGGE